ncbi:MAG TPA: NAD(P)-binding domain-containing protein [Pyrinomonadaceae bacterium]|nr:NAD(P)-binding domain-containing protein [Pyrinomonadaceae bacterium]
MANYETELLIIGAGPFGLALAAQASHLGIAHVMAGQPMEFWRKHMPHGMYLRSGCDWHLDPQNIHTIENFLQSRGQTPRDVEPLSLEFYLSYAEWFQQQKQITSLPSYICELHHTGNRNFTVFTAAGDTIHARNVALAPGFRHFANVPDELKALLPANRYEHTCRFTDFSSASNQRYLIIGGRQSAFEWAALLLEAGANRVFISHRHDSPAFKTSDWSWVNPLVEAMADDPNWFRRLSQEEKDALSQRQWAEGRLKLEPWLEARLASDRVKVLPRTVVANAEVIESTNELRVTLSNGEEIHCDQIVLATGYQVDMTRLPILSSGNLLAQLATRNGFPVLDDHFQTSIPGLFITSMPAIQDFGPFFGFTIAVRVSAKLICDAVITSERV